MCHFQQATWVWNNLQASMGTAEGSAYVQLACDIWDLPNFRPNVTKWQLLHFDNLGIISYFWCFMSAVANELGIKRGKLVCSKKHFAKVAFTFKSFKCTIAKFTVSTMLTGVHYSSHIKKLIQYPLTRHAWSYNLLSSLFRRRFNSAAIYRWLAHTELISM